MKNDIQQLIKGFSSVPCLKVIPPETIKMALASDLIDIKRTGRNEIIHFDGDDCDHMAVILDGSIVVERIDETGHLMAVTEFGKGQSIGANLVFSSSPYYPMTVSAREPVTMVCLKKQLLSDLCTGNEDFLQYFLRIISDHTLVLGNKIKYHVNSSIRAKIIAYLNRLYMNQRSYDIVMNMSKTDLALRMGVQRTSLSRELQKMRDEGLIEFERRQITILDKKLISR